jgi:Carboxypeptidase regulatory-like domain
MGIPRRSTPYSVEGIATIAVRAWRSVLGRRSIGHGGRTPVTQGAFGLHPAGCVLRIVPACLALGAAAASPLARSVHAQVSPSAIHVMTMPLSNGRRAPRDLSTDSSGTLTGVLLGREDGGPIEYGTVFLVETGSARFSDAAGRFRMTRLVPGTYTLRARQIGYTPIDTTIQVAPAPTTTTVTLRLTRIAFKLAEVGVTGHRQKGCVATGIPDSTINPTLTAIFAQVRENVDRFRLLLEEYPFRFTREERIAIRRSAGGDNLQSLDTAVYESRARRPYHVGGIIYSAIDATGRSQRYMYLPTFRDLADPAFLSAHCFAYGGTESLDGSRGVQVIKIDFVPARSISVPDVEGSIYLDAHYLVVRRAVFRMTKPSEADPPVIGLLVTTTFREIAPLIPVFDSVESDQTLPPERAHRADGIGGGANAPVARSNVEDDRLLGFTFERGKPGEQGGSPFPRTGAGANPGATRLPATATIPRDSGGVAVHSGTRGRPVFHDLSGCTPPSAEDTIDVALYATLHSARPHAGSDTAWLSYADRVLAAVRGAFVMPRDLPLPAFGYPFQEPSTARGRPTSADTSSVLGVAPAVSSALEFTLDWTGALRGLRIAASSLSGPADTSVLAAITAASYPVVPEAHRVHGPFLFSLVVSTTRPAVGDRATVVGRIVVPAWTPSRRASMVDIQDLAPDVAPARTTHDSATLEFVVDERGHAVMSTVHAVTLGDATASDSGELFVARLARGLPRVRFEPALIGACPVQQILRVGLRAAPTVHPSRPTSSHGHGGVAAP